MARYDISTQRKSWKFSTEEVSTLRSDAHRVSLERIREEGVSMEHAPLTPEEVAHLRRYFEKSIMSLCNSMRLPTKVMATAIVYFKRFHLTRSIMEYNPTVTLLASVYAATKVEEQNCAIHQILDFAFHPDSPLAKENVAENIEADVILGYELQFLKHLGFQLVCYHPFRSVTAILDLRREAGAPPAELEKLSVAATRMITGKALFNDVILTSTPGQLALAAVVGSIRKGVALAVGSEALLESIQSETDPELRKRAECEIDRIIAALSDAAYDQKLSLDKLVELEKRRRQVSNRDLDPNSEIYKEKQRLLEEERDEHRRKKARKADEKKRKAQAELLGTNLLQ